jgi:hypothetical protein
MMQFDAIQFETVIAEIFQQLPPIVDANSVSYLVHFQSGTREDLDQYIALPSEQIKYPLVWLVDEKDDGNYNREPMKRQARFIVAVRSNTKGQSNDFTYQTDFKVLLDPVAQNVLKALERSGRTRYGKFSIKRKKNFYTAKNENGSLDVWNALQLDIEVAVRTDRTIKTIKF